MACWIDVGSPEQIPDGTMREIEAGGAALLLFNLGGVIHATAAICPHHAAWLSQGQISGEASGGWAIDCPRHMGRFDIATGQQLRGPPCPALRLYAVRVDGGRILAEV